MKGGFHDELAKEVQVTSVSSIGSGLSQYSSLSSLDKNGDGIISADELAAANSSATSPSSTKSTTSTSRDDGASVAQKIAGDILSIILQMQQSSTSDDDSTTDDGSKGILASLDVNGDGKLTTDEILSADTSSIASSPSGSDDPILAEVLDDMQTALRAYHNTYGTSAAADPDTSDEVQTA
jgi:EF hand